MWIDSDTEGYSEISGPREYLQIGEGIPRGLPEYVMSRSELMRFKECNERWQLGIPRDTSRSLDFGSMIDGIITLSDDEFNRCYVIAPEEYLSTRWVCPQCESESPKQAKCRNCKVDRVEQAVSLPWNANSDACRKMMADWEDSGRTMFRQKDYLNGQKAQQRFKESQDGWLWSYSQQSKSQVMLRLDWQDKATGIRVPVKCMIDFAPKEDSFLFCDSLGDLKTTKDARYPAWVKQVYEHHYHVQAAMYLDMWNFLFSGEYRRRTRFYHLIMENVAPYVCTYRELDPEFIQMGRETYQDALDSYCACLKNKVWPGYDTEPSRPKKWMSS